MQNRCYLSIEMDEKNDQPKKSDDRGPQDDKKRF